MHACGHDVHMAALVALTPRRARARATRCPLPLLARLPAERGGLPLGRRAARRGELAAIAPAAVVAAHVHPELPWGDGRAGRGRGQRLVRRRRDHDRRRAHARRLPAPRARSDPGARAGRGRAPRPGRHGGSTRLSAASLTVGVIEGGQRRERDPAQRARARGALRAHRPEDRAGAARAGRARSSRGSPRPTAAAAAVELAPGEPALENDARDRGARARAARRGRPAQRPANGARAARTTSPSSARWRRSRWRSSGSTAPTASPRARCTTPSCWCPTRPSGRSRARRRCCTSPRRAHRRARDERAGGSTCRADRL